MESDANQAFEYKFSSRVGNQPRPNTRENPLFPPKSPVKSEPAAAYPVRADNLADVTSAVTVFQSPFLTLPTTDNGAVSDDQDSVFTAFQRLQSNIQHTLADQVTPLRLAGHLSVLAVASIILIMSQMKIPALSISMEAFRHGAQEISVAGQRTSTKAVVVNASDNNASLQRSVIANTVISGQPVQASSQPRQDIQHYTVQSGDTVLAIAAKYGLNPETVLWANNAIEQDPDKLSIGDQLNILPVNGVLHIVKPGDTLSTLAAQYKVALDSITGYKANNLANAAAALTVGNQLVIPGGVKAFVQPQYANVATTSDAPDNASKGVGSFSWPTGGEISQKYWSGHPAIDISSWTGNPVKAADSGYVALASSGGAWNTGYGNYIIIDHGNGFSTLYAHLSSVFVRSGENVTRGEQIGLVGNTGHSTGPHLHFEIRYQGVQRNPVTYLP